MSQDSAIRPIDHINRAKELDHKMIFSTQHGIKDGEYEYYKLCKENNIKFGFGVEAYWVKDRFEKDNTNNHIILLATDSKSRKAINKILSEASKTGYYYRPRVDYELIDKLPNNIFVTTACLGFGGYGEEESERFILQLKKKFKNNFMLEIQNHKTEKQIHWNKFILKMHKKHDIKLIAGMDSHFIYEEQADERTAYLESKGIRYENEDGWYMDYPDYETAFKRFKDQKLFSDKEIHDALQNTNKLLEFEDIILDDDIKLPTIYPNLSQEEKDEKLLGILREEFKTRTLTKPKDEYVEAIKNEFQVIKDTKFSDYFLFNYEMIKLGKKKGGNLTLTSRGSAPSWYLNNLLNFTTIDRIDSPIQMYPERFATADRILKSKSLFDIDFNLSDPKPFIEAQKELLGDDNSYYMVAYGKLKEKSAWKMYAKVNNVDFDTANNISKQLEKYEKDYKYADDDEKDILNVYDYIDKEFHHIYDKSKVYQGIIDSIAPSPCSHLLLSNPISEEVGLIKVKNEICASIDGATAEKFGYMKNDLLTVTVVDIIYKVYEKIGIKPHTFPELIKITKDDKKTWGIYKNGLTMCINQCERPSTRDKVMKFKIQNIAEASDFSASIRPGASSVVDQFLNREYFEYGIKEIDELIQTKYKPSSFIFYQEEIMKLLSYAGFEPSETYTILKGIAKKKPEVVDLAKNKFYKGFIDKGYLESDIDTFWHVMELNASYSFNSSHSLSVAGDSCYGAYLKANYPYEFYEVVLNIYSEKKDNEKVALIKQEMKKGFGIDVGELKFGNDNRKFTIDKTNNRINQSLLSCKNINQNSANVLYEVGLKNIVNLKDLIDILKITKDDKNKIVINKTKLETLAKVDYFKDFAKPRKVLRFIEIYNNIKSKKTFSKKDIDPKLEKLLTSGAYYDKILIENKRIKNELLTDDMEIIKQSAKTSVVNYYGKVRILPLCEETAKTYKNVDVDKLLDLIWDDLPDEDFHLIPKLQYALDLLGYINFDIPSGKYIFFTKWSGIAKKSGKPGCFLRSMRNDKESYFKVTKGLKLPPQESIIIAHDISVKKYKGENGKFKESYTIEDYSIIKEA